MTKPNRRKRILAIDPGTKQMGVALLDDGKLVYHGVKVIAKGRSPQETLQRARDTVARLIDDLRPDMLAVERTFFSKSRNAALLNVLFDEIRTMARRRKLEWVSYSPAAIKKWNTGYGWSDKAQVAAVVAAKFPELKAYLGHDRAWKERFHMNMFDAVALGVMVEVTANSSQPHKSGWPKKSSIQH